MEQEKKNTQPFRSHCYNCDKETNQDILFNDHEIGPREIIFRNDQGDKTQSVWEVVADIWTISKCKGCDRINFRHILRNSPPKETDLIFQFPKKPLRPVPRWTIKLPISYLEILQEVYDSINDGLLILSLTGIRTLLDIYIVNKVGDVGTFKQKIERLVSDGIITSSKATVLEAAIEAGNASAHRGYKPDQETLFQILDIVENLLQSEVVDRAADEIKQKTPTRKK